MLVTFFAANDPMAPGKAAKYVSLLLSCDAYVVTGHLGSFANVAAWDFRSRLHKAVARDTISAHASVGLCFQDLVVLL